MKEAYTVEMYEGLNGHSEVANFIKGLEPKMAAKFLRQAEFLEQYGPELREPNTKHLEDGIFELRCRQGNNCSRFLFFFEGGEERKIIITNGFIKKQQTTPRNQITLAKKYRREYFEKKIANNK